MKSKKIKEKTTGDFKTNLKFIEFVGGKGHLNFLSNEATIEGKYLSGLMYGETTFKLKIYSDNTVDFDEINTELTTTEERERLLQIIEDQTVSSYRNRMVINELPFTSVEKVKDKSINLYLAVEYIKPIAKLGSLFDDEIQISDGAMSNLDSLLDFLGTDEDSDSNEVETTQIESGPIETILPTPNTFLEDQFSKMKKEKISELKSSLTKKQNELSKLDFQLKSIESNIANLESDVKLLEHRISDLQPIEEPNGYYFFVSERLNETIEFEPEIEKVIREKVSKIKSINTDNFMKLFTNGDFNISLAKIDEETYEKIENYQDLPEEILDKLSSLNLILDENTLTYSGELSWGEIVNKMIKMGFCQNPDFDKACGSNSYSSKESNKPEIITK